MKTGFRKPGIYTYDGMRSMKTNLSHTTKKNMKKKEQLFFSRPPPSPPSDTSTESQENLSQSTISTISIPTNSESNQSSFSDLTLSEKETSKSFVGPSCIFVLPDFTSPVNAPPPIRKWKRKKGRSTILSLKV